MVLLCFLILLFSTIFVVSIKQKRTLFAFLIGIYLLSFLSTLILNKYQPQTHIQFVPTFYLLVILFLWFFPFKNICPNNILEISIKKRKVQILMLIIGLFSLMAFLFFAYYAYMLFTMDDLEFIRDKIQEEAFLPSGMLTAFLVIVSSLYFFNQFLFFFALKEQYKWFYPVLMFVSSLSFPFMVLCYFGRDGVLYWGANFIVLFLLFKKSLPKNMIRKVKQISFIFLGCFAIILLFITVSRFGNNIKKVYVSLLDYSGQQLQNFSEAYNLNASTYNLLPGAERFLIKIKVLREVDSEMIIKIRKAAAGDEYNVFGFFVKSFIWSIGRIGTLILSLIISFFVHGLRRNFSKKKRIEDFMLLFTIFQIPMNGVFYYRQSISYMDMGILLCVLICFLFKATYFKIKPSRQSDCNCL